MAIKIRSLLLLFPLILSVPAQASMVFYTDSQHPPVNLPPDVSVVMLDSPEQLQSEMFGDLSTNPQQAEIETRQIMQSLVWRQKQQQLVESYRQVIHAWEIGLKKYPALVFDDSEVVYGTTDIAKAISLRQGGHQ